MSDVFTLEKRSRVMSQIRSRGNKTTELRLIALMKACRIVGWRRNFKIFGKPDFVFRKQRVAIFVDGCFWHGCKEHGVLPKQNIEFWAAKIDGNRLRDRRVGKELRRAGWKVLRIWEHELRSPEAVVRRIEVALMVAGC